MADENEDAPNEEKLDELEEHIEEARAHADEAVKPKESFVDSGSENPGEDDQTIAPG
ncbi:MAG TPA: hypothetical protein VM121_07565 [Acidimicrobiales bacterium]|nr:hypothetical protein [Acidimicrobiales bacterium]